MFRAGPPVSAQDKQERQKQKKKLSFKEPEIEGPQKSHFLPSGIRSSQGRTTGKELCLRNQSSSLEDLTLEDQAIQIAQSVGQAFSGLNVENLNQAVNHSQAISYNSQIKTSEPDIKNKDCSSYDSTSYQRSCQLRNFKISTKDQDYLDALSPPILDKTMRCPPAHVDDIPSSSLLPMDEAYLSGTQHQVQLLKYQLDQQNQKTQAALHQVQLLKDQMEAESAARYNAQTQNLQLMTQNKELLDHIERLFQQIEDLERCIKTLENDRRPSKIPFLQESQTARLTTSYTGANRLTSNQVARQPIQNYIQTRTGRRSSLTSTTKCYTPQNKPFTTQIPAQTSNSRRGSLTSVTRPYSTQSKPMETSIKVKDNALKIGDLSPTLQNSTLSPFNTGFKPKTKPSNQTITDKPINTRGRTNSLSSSIKIKQSDAANVRDKVFSNNNALDTSGISNKKYSGSFSDLYNNISGFQVSKPLLIEESSSRTASAISNVNLNITSKLPRFQPYTGYQKKDLANDCDQVYTIGKEAFKNSQETSLLFSR